MAGGFFGSAQEASFDCIEKFAAPLRMLALRTELILRHRRKEHGCDQYAWIAPRSGLFGWGTAGSDFFLETNSATSGRRCLIQ
jgi:hypothetical protein